MTFRPCIVIPIYNHKDTIAQVVARLAPHGLPILIVDDGSDDATQGELRRLAQLQPDLSLFRLNRNGGKGAAVMRGFREAHTAGFTHALQIDADGQHDLEDVPRFIERSRARPDAVVAGQPIYDASAPASRRYGRFATHVWVWIETLSLAIGDSMCGFRMYPLAPTLVLIEKSVLPFRMAFDIEIIVRLFWMGVPVENISTQVIYPPGGLSHFDLWRDNLRISWMHTRLFFGMLVRLPLILWRKAYPPAFSETHWSRRTERGSTWGIQFTLATYRILGDTAARILLRPIVAWFFLTGRSARNASRSYLARLHAHTGRSPSPTWHNSYRHMLAFADSAVDKLAAWTGNISPSDVEFHNRSEFDRLLASGRGAVLLGAHLGNLEMLRALANINGIVKINAVVYTEHARKFVSALSATDPRFQVNLLHIPRMGPDTAIALQDKINRGEMLVIVGDRTPPADNGRVVQADFLGRPALFPQGPFILAALLECPVYLFFCTRELGGYQIHFEPFAEQVELPRTRRNEAIAEYAQRYANRLASLCERAPFQWFNFFDFWATPFSHASSKENNK
ncbi:glycosyltransferase family 2 protein [Herbaspirillum sp. HC18]|nr:glycosyltransferase family 2 protein [Herbaspirillum sp. HC18]